MVTATLLSWTAPQATLQSIATRTTEMGAHHVRNTYTRHEVQLRAARMGSRSF